MRILLSVGCDTYLHVPKLTAAAKDARSVFSALVGTQEHQYDPDHSKLLISPNAEQFRKALSDILYDHSGIAVFTLFFAGHATVYDETLYLGLADTRPDRIPATAIGFSDVLRTTAGARPKQANFIIDACNAGGLGFDIGSILKRSIVGNSDTMGISFVASATAEQSAGETAEGGQFTVEFAKTLIGDIYIQQARPFLSLAEISQQIQESGALREQNISYWSLNLQGPNLFAKNLHFSGPSQATDRIVAQLQKQKVDTGKRAAGFKSAIAMITNGVNERSLASVLEPVFAGMEPYQRASMIYGLAEGLSMELSTADDPFLEARVHTVLLAQLLGLPESQAPIIAGVIERYIDANRRALSRLHEALAIDRYALLIDSMSDLYELPIRISDILGQCALLFFAQPVLSEDDSKLIFGVVTKILDQYGNSILALTDEQATGYLLFLEMCRNASWLEQIEEVIGRLYHDLHKNFARCADYSLNAESRFAVLAERYQHSFALTENLYNFPSDLTTVILTFAALGSFDDVVDYTLIDIDHTSINYFVPEDLKRFGTIEGLKGANYTLALGRDFWRCIDLRRLLRGDILPKFHSSTSHLFREEGVCSLAAALALRDRLPWHAVEIRTRLDRTRDTPGGKS